MSNNLRILNKRLAELFPNGELSKMIVSFTALPLAMMDFTGSPLIIWSKVLGEAQKYKSGIFDIVKMAQAEYPDDEILLAAIKDETEIRLSDKGNITVKLNRELKLEKDDLVKLLEAGKIKESLSRLQYISDSVDVGFYNRVVALKFRLNELEKEKNENLITAEVFKVNQSKLVKSILSIVDEAAINPSDVSFSKNSTSVNFDKSALEKIMKDRNDLVEVEWLLHAVEASRSICKVNVGNSTYGTGWIYKNNYLMTNNHVIESREQALVADIVFNYQLSGNDKVKTFKLDPNTFFETGDSEGLDFSCIRIMDSPELEKFGSLEVNVEDKFIVGDLVNIIQHPTGGVKKIAMPDEIISIWTEKQYLFYLVDTEIGSSGSPIFNQDWEVIGLHHAGKDDEGFVINQKGEKKVSNRGLFISSIIDELNKRK